MRSFSGRHELSLALFLVILCAAISWANPAFLSLSNLFDILKSSVVIGLMATGVLVVLVSGGIDISFAAIAATSMYVTVKALPALGAEGSIVAAFTLSAAVGALLGTVNAVFIGLLGLPTLIVTLGTQSLFRGFLLAFVGTAVIANVPPALVRFSRATILDATVPGGEVVGLSASFLILLALAGITWAILRFTLPGRAVYALGGNPAAAERAGFRLTPLRFAIHAYVGLLSGVAGIVHAATLRNANPFDLVGTELNVLAAVVLGGASIVGGRGSVPGTLLGVLLIVIVNGSLILVGVPSGWQRVAVGAILVVSAVLSARRAA